MEAQKLNLVCVNGNVESAFARVPETVNVQQSHWPRGSR